MVPERGAKGHAGIEQRPIRPRELVLEVGRPLRAVEVVAEHHHQIEGKGLVRARHLRGDVELRLLAGAVVADDGELQRLGPVGKRRTGLTRSEHTSRQTGNQEGRQ